MPLGFNVTKTLLGRSERVKSVEIHPHEPWVLAGLYSGHCFIWNYETGVIVRTFEVSDVPVRCCKFVVRKKWVVCGSDDMFIRVYNYNTHEKVHEQEAHTDYIRSITIHPTLPYVLTSSDDMSIKLWDWDKNWENTIIFEGHTHYVMQIEINPKESNTFASASLDRTIRIWGLSSVNPHFSLEGHERGVNCVSYYQGGDRPFLVSGADDNLVKVWDYQTKTCVATLEGHTSNVSAVAFHPNLPIILSGSEDNTVRVWHSSTYGWEDTLNYSMERCWSISALNNSNKVAFGYDLGTVMVSLGQEEPAASMDKAGKITFAKGNELFRKMIPRKGDIPDGEILSLPEKEIQSTDVYCQYVKHNSKGTFVAVCGDGEFTIYSAIKIRNKAYGAALEFAWSDRPDTYATRETKGKIKLFKKFKEVQSLRPSFAVEGIFGGHLLAVKSEDFVDFYDWDELRIVCRFDVVPDKIYWSDNICIMCCDDSVYVLQYDEDLVKKFFDNNVETDDQGIEGSFTLETEISKEKVTSGCFEGDVFFYTTQNGRLNYIVGQKTVLLAHLDKPYFILGYFNKTNRIYLMDKNYNVISYKIQFQVLAYEIAIVSGDLEEAAELLEDIGEEHHTKLARFLETTGHTELALEVTKDADHKFDLAINLKKLELARQVIEESPSSDKWRQLTDAALGEFEFDLAIEGAKIAGDLSTLLLIYSSLGFKDKIIELGQSAQEAGRFNIAFMCNFLTHRVEICLELLLSTQRFAEGAIFARTYLPSAIPGVVKQWQASLGTDKSEIAEILTSPDTAPQLWDNFDQCLKIEKAVEEKSYSTKNLPTSAYAQVKASLNTNILIDGLVDIDVDKVKEISPATEDFITPSPEEEEETLVEKNEEVEEEEIQTKSEEEPEEEEEEMEAEIEEEVEEEEEEAATKEAEVEEK